MAPAANAPGAQFQTASFSKGEPVGKRGERYEQHAAICLKTRAFPSSVNQDVPFHLSV
jgi:hypothetical protein